MRALPAALQAEFRGAAADLEQLDRAAYKTAHRDPLEPILGLGPATAPVAFFGRDPGRDEVMHGVPFIGAGGRHVRRVLSARQGGGDLSSTEQAQRVGEPYFWANTVPYKPIANKAWSMAVKRRFQPLVARVLCELWQQTDIITLGREAFLWFGIGQPRALGERLKQHWAAPERFSTAIACDYQSPSGVTRHLRLHPLPHPSPLNATWFKRFPGLLEARLNQLALAQ